MVDVDSGTCDWQEDLQLFPSSLTSRLKSDIREYLPKGSQRAEPSRRVQAPRICCVSTVGPLRPRRSFPHVPLSGVRAANSLGRVAQAGGLGQCGHLGGVFHVLDLHLWTVPPVL